MAKEEIIEIKKEIKKVLNLEEFTKQIRKDFGKDSLINAEEKESYKDVVASTPLSLKNALGTGGYAIGKIHTIDGDTSAGKSTLLYDVIGNSQKKFGKQCLLIDKEDSYTREYGALMGIDNKLLTIVTPHTLENMYSVIELGLRNNLFGVIGVDSVTSFAPQGRFEGSEAMGIEARVNSDKMRIIADAIARTDTALILIQQIRSTIGGFGDPTVVSGGKAIPFYAHTRTRITRSEIDRELQQNVMKFTIIKNKLAAPFKVGTVVYRWNIGFDPFSEIAELALEFNIIEKTGKTFMPPNTEDVKIIGKKAMIQYLRDNPDYTKSVIEPLVHNYLNSETNLRADEIDESELT